MVIPRTYTATDIMRLIDLLRGTKDITDAEIAGMDRLGQLLAALDRMSDAEIAQVVNRPFRSP
jgi:hypothetical protein